LTHPDTPQQPEPSAPADETPERLMVGIIGAPHGIRGEMRVRIVSDFPERVATLSHIYLGPEGERRRLLGFRGGGQSTIIRVAGVTSREDAAQYRGMPLYMDIRDAKPLEPDENYWYELIDMQVFSPEGDVLGTLTSILETGANDVYVVTQPDGKELLLPALKEVILDVDVPNKRMTAKPLEYL
jgi:16S rRNA processing protein RimM